MLSSEGLEAALRGIERDRAVAEPALQRLIVLLQLRDLGIGGLGLEADRPDLFGAPAAGVGLLVDLFEEALEDSLRNWKPEK